MTAAQVFELLWQLLLGGVGTLCFGVLFGIPRKCYLACGATGAVGWLAYELAVMLGVGAVTANLLAAIPLTLLARVFAVSLKAPVTVFLYSHHQLPARQKGLRVTHFDGYSRVQTFQMPDYSLMPKEEDHRRTLYWSPAVKADGRGEATVEFYNNSSCKELVVSAEGITADGQAIVYKANK